MTPSVGARVFGLLSADAAVVALCATRIYPGRAPQELGGVQAHVVYSVIDEIPQVCLQGYTSRLTKARVQIDSYARGYADAQALADAVCAVLQGRVAGDISAVPLSRSDSYDDAPELHRVSADFSLWIKEQ